MCRPTKQLLLQHGWLSAGCQTQLQLLDIFNAQLMFACTLISHMCKIAGDLDAVQRQQGYLFLCTLTG